jgi:hypothetical protein
VPEKVRSIIVASSRARTGKTLLARLIADHFSLLGIPRRLFDTDAADKKLRGYFPEATVVDLERVPDQMKLFDTLSSADQTTQIIDLTHRSFAKFFGLMRDIDYVAEAQANGVETVIFYIPDIEPDSYEQGLSIREHFRDAAFVLVKNGAIGEPGRDASRSEAFAALASHNSTLVLPKLDPFFVSAVEDPRLSLSEFTRRLAAKDSAPPLPPGQMSMAYMSREARNEIAGWLQVSFQEIRRSFRDADLHARILAHDRFGA